MESVYQVKAAANPGRSEASSRGMHRARRWSWCGIRRRLSRRREARARMPEWSDNAVDRVLERHADLGVLGDGAVVSLFRAKLPPAPRGPNPIPHPPGLGPPVHVSTTRSVFPALVFPALWVARPATEEVDDLLKFGPGSRGTSIADRREALVKRTWRGAGRSNGIDRRQWAGNLDLLLGSLLVANALGSRHRRCFRYYLRSRHCLRSRRYLGSRHRISMLMSRTARGGIPAFAALMARRPQRPRRPSGGILLPHRLGRG